MAIIFFQKSLETSFLNNKFVNHINHYLKLLSTKVKLVNS